VYTGTDAHLTHSTRQNVGFSSQTEGDYGANPATFDSIVGDLFGGSARVTRQMGITDLDLKETASHTTTGIPYAIHGSATLVQQQVAHALASYQDPIKAILGTAVHKDREIVIRRKYVVGGKAMITPERAPARTVAIKEDERRVVLARYGGDLEMNLNLFLRPDEAAEEFNMKLNAQKGMLEQQLCTLGYDKLMKEGTLLHAAMSRASPVTTHLTEFQRVARAEKMYVHTLFGTMNKNMYPLESLMAAAKAANLYTPGAPHGYTRCIVPNGMFEMHKYTKPENLVYNLNGIKSSDRKPIKLSLEGGHKDPRTNMTILVHAGRPNTEMRGTPYAVNGGGGLTREKKIGVYYRIPGDSSSRKYRYANCATGSWINIDSAVAATVKPVVYTVHASSAIMAVPGPDTGELLYAYPSTGISTSQTTESMKMQLRVYLGAVLYDPTKVLILPDVFVEGITACADITFGNLKPEDLLANDGPVYSNRFRSASATKTVEGENEGFTYDGTADCPDALYCGRVQQFDNTTNVWSDISTNHGHLGPMDDPEIMSQLGGYVFDRNHHMHA